MTDQTNQESVKPAGTWEAINRALFAPHRMITEYGDKRQARLIAIISLVFFGANFLGVLAILLLGVEITPGILANFALTFFLLVGYGFSRSRYYRFSSYIIIWVLTAVGILNFGTSTEVSRSILTYLAFGLIIASSVISTRYLIIYAITSCLSIFLIPLYNPAYDGAVSDVGLIIGFSLLVIANKRYRDGLEKERLGEVQAINKELKQIQSELEVRVHERTEALAASNRQVQRRANQLQTVTDISRSISMVQDIGKLLPSITQSISRGFGYYHVGIFLVDQRGENAELRAANSEGGQRMLERRHRLRVGEEGIIGFVTRFGRARIALDVGEDAVFFNNPDLPETRSEIGLPLYIGGNIIGALDVQSKEAGAFSPEDVSALGALANQVSIAIQNANLFTQAQQAIQESERAYKEFIREEWEKIAPTLPTSGYSYTNAGIAPITETDQREKSGDTITFPVTLRGEVIGELGIRTQSKDSPPGAEEVAILRATADRVALALENARLFQDAQLRAATERAISEMSTRIGASVDVDSILQSTVQELGQLVGDSEVIIQISRPAAK